MILNPLDARCPFWGPAEELRRSAEAKAIAASLYQPTSVRRASFSWRRLRKFRPSADLRPDAP